MRNEATLAADLASRGRRARRSCPRGAACSRRLTDAERFPALHAALASGAFDHDDDPDDEFVFGLERVLDGVDALVRARAGAGQPGPSSSSSSAV